MIWFIIGVAPLLALLVWALIKHPGPTLTTLGIGAVGFGLILSAMYGMWQMGWVAQCGGDTFWTSDNCP